MISPPDQPATQGRPLALWRPGESPEIYLPGFRQLIIDRRLPEVADLLQRGFPADAQGSWFAYMAVMNRDLPMLQLLIAHGTPIRWYQGIHPVEVACQFHWEEGVNYFALNGHADALMRQYIQENREAPTVFDLFSRGLPPEVAGLSEGPVADRLCDFLDHLVRRRGARQAAARGVLVHAMRDWSVPALLMQPKTAAQMKALLSVLSVSPIEALGQAQTAAARRGCLEWQGESHDPR